MYLYKQHFNNSTETAFNLTSVRETRFAFFRENRSKCGPSALATPTGLAAPFSNHGTFDGCNSNENYTNELNFRKMQQQHQPPRW